MVPIRFAAGGPATRWWWGLTGMLLILVCGAPGAVAEDLSYLDALEAEADRLEMLSDAARLDAEADAEAAVPAAADAVPGTVPSAPGRAEVPTGLTREQFEATLTRYRGTHMLYEKLSEPARAQVFDAYHEDNRIAEIRRRVVELL